MKLDRLKVLVGLREQWQEQVRQVRQVYDWRLADGTHPLRSMGDPAGHPQQ
jgi:hypothetical protein